MWEIFRHGARWLFRRPGRTALSIGVLALGVALVTATFSIVDGILWRPLDLPQSDELVAIVETDADSPSFLSAEDVRHLREHQSSFDVLAAHVTFYNLVTPGAGASQGLVGAYVTSDFLELLRVRPVAGRGFQPADAERGAEPTALLSYRVWRTRLGGRPDVVGERMLINGEPATVIGILPEGVHLPYRHDVWQPLSLELAEERGWSLFTMGRLAPGVDVRRARAELRQLAARLDADRPLAEGRRDWSVMAYVPATIDAAYRSGLHLLWAASLGVLLIASANVASLRLAEGLERSSEIALRRALGATTPRLMALLGGETALLVAAGAAAGLPIAWCIIALYRTHVLPSIGMRAYWIDATLDPRAAAASVGAAGLAALCGGLLPACLAIAGVDGRSALTGVGRSSANAVPARARARRALVVAEVALAATLCLACGLLIKSVWALRAADPGMRTERVLTGLLSLLHLRLGVEDADAVTAAFERRLASSLEARPEVLSAALATGIPGSWRGGLVPFAAGGAELDAESLPRARVAFVGAHYFEILGTPTLLGRTFRPHADPRRARAAVPMEIVVNRTLAETHLAGGGPLGARLRLRERAAGEEGETWAEARVVGVVADQLTSTRERGTAVIYAPLERTPPSFVSRFVLVRGRGLDTGSTDGAALAEVLQDEVARADLRVSLHEVAPLSVVVDRTTWPHRTLRNLLTLFAGAALALAAMGIYAVMTFSTARRSHELGIRAALGARASDLRRLILGEGLRLIAVGLAIGSILAIAAARALSAVLYGVERWDLTVIAAGLGAMTLTGVAASVAPALRAGRADPAAALREE